MDQFLEDLEACWPDQIPTNVEAGRLTGIEEAGPNMLNMSIMQNNFINTQY